MKSKELVAFILKAMDEMKAQDPVHYDLKGKSSLTEHILLATGTSSTHLKGIADRVHQGLKQESVYPLGVEGLDAGNWLLLDYNEVIVHLVLPERRKELDLESLFNSISHLRDGD